MFRYSTTFHERSRAKEELSRWGFRHTELADGTVGVLFNYMKREKVCSIVQVVAMFLVKLREFAESNLKTKVCSNPLWF